MESHDTPTNQVKDVEVDTQAKSKKEEGEEKVLEDKVVSKLQDFFNEYHLTDFQKFAVTKFIKQNIADKNNLKVERVRGWLFHKINGQKVPTEFPLQKGCPDIVPGLTATPWWSNDKFPWIKDIEDNYEVIKQELLQLRNQKGFQPYRGPSWVSKIKAKDGVGTVGTDSGDWNVFYLFLHDMKFDENCKKCPKTVEIIEKYFPRQYNHCFFSAVTPGTHIIKHNGPTNKKLRFHMPLIGVEGSQLRVGEEIRAQKAGSCYVFDDSFEHEAWHQGATTRITLIVDFWHPDLSDAEVKFLTLLQNSKMRYERALSEHDPDKDNFYSIIDRSRTLLDSNDWWTVDDKDKQDHELIQDQQNLHSFAGES